MDNGSFERHRKKVLQLSAERSNYYNINPDNILLLSSESLELESEFFILQDHIMTKGMIHTLRVFDPDRVLTLMDVLIETFFNCSYRLTILENCINTVIENKRSPVIELLTDTSIQLFSKGYPTPIVISNDLKADVSSGGGKEEARLVPAVSFVTDDNSQLFHSSREFIFDCIGLWALGIEPLGCHFHDDNLKVSFSMSLDVENKIFICYGKKK